MLLKASEPIKNPLIVKLKQSKSYVFDFKRRDFFFIAMRKVINNEIK